MSQGDLPLFCRDTLRHGIFCQKLLKYALWAETMALSALRADTTLSPTPLRCSIWAKVVAKHELICWTWLFCDSKIKRGALNRRLIWSKFLPSVSLHAEQHSGAKWICCNLGELAVTEASKFLGYVGFQFRSAVVHNCTIFLCSLDVRNIVQGGDPLYVGFFSTQGSGGYTWPKWVRFFAKNNCLGCEPENKN